MVFECLDKELKDGDLLPRTSTVDIVVSDGSLDFGEKAPPEGQQTNDGDTNDDGNNEGASDGGQ